MERERMEEDKEDKEEAEEMNEEVHDRKDEGGLKSIDAIAIKLVSSAEQERRISQEEEKEEKEGEREEKNQMEEEHTEDVTSNENVLRCSSAMLKTLSNVSEPVLLSAGCNPGGRKSV